MERIILQYQGGLRTEATHERSGTTLITDAPVDNQGQGQSFSPTDLVATGLGGCILTIIGIIAQRQGIDLAEGHVEVTKEMTTEGPRRIARLAVTCHLPAWIEEADRRRFEHGARTCPVHRSLHPDIDAPIDFVYS